MVDGARENCKSIPRLRSAMTVQVVSLLMLGSLIALLPLAGPSAQMVQLMTLAFIFSLPAIGLSLLYGEGGQMSVASGALYGVGAYVAAIGAREQLFSFWLALPVAAVAGALAAFPVGLTALRVRGHYFLIVTFAFAELWRITVTNLRTITGGNQGILVLDDITVPGIGDIQSLLALYYIALAFAFLAGLAVVTLRFSPFGLALRAIRENERLAISLGLNAAMVRLCAFAVSGAIAGIGGVLYVYNVKHIGPDLFGAYAGIQVVLILLVGGARSPVGPVIGSLIFFLTPELIRLDPITTQIVYGVVLILIVLISPQGLAPGFASLTGRVCRLANRRPASGGTTP
jgi:branched-chain amino acid transport system permease protein